MDVALNIDAAIQGSTAAQSELELPLGSADSLAGDAVCYATARAEGRIRHGSPDRDKTQELEDRQGSLQV